MKKALCCILILFSTADACRLWGVIAHNGYSLGNDSDNYTLISEELKTYYQQGACQPQGWSLGYYHCGKLIENQTLFRSPITTDLDSARYASAVGAVLAPSENASLAIGHLRTASSGASAIPDPHPFLFFRDSLCYSLVHNGTIDKLTLLDLLTDNGMDTSWIKDNPPHTYGNGDWQGDGFAYVVDSELLLLWLVKNIDASGGVLCGLARALTKLAVNVPSACQKNIIFSDGKRLYISGGTNCLYYRFGAKMIAYGDKTYSINHQAVMTEPPTSGSAADLGWTSIRDDQLVILSPDTTMIFTPEALLELAGKNTAVVDDSRKVGRTDIHENRTIGLTAPNSGHATLSIYSLSGKCLWHETLPVNKNRRITIAGSGARYRNASAEGMAIYVLTAGAAQRQGVIPLKHARELGLRIQGE